MLSCSYLGGIFRKDIERDYRRCKCTFLMQVYAKTFLGPVVYT